MDMSEKLWDLSNIITGFAAAQSVTMTIVMGKGELARSLRSGKDHLTTLCASVISSVFYIGVIFWCQVNSMAGTGEREKLIWTWVTWGRCATVILFMAIMLYVLLLHYIKQNKKPDQLNCQIH
ncbi:hypothetical protein P3T40_002926 [Paraburkholderia sp. EB58]|jgi:hypothetical protein|uniref:hypothetical protein n=1 Tax=Paraburkholderia sp. EB58 TaxID=3035125 RepID=UPI003D24F63C